MQEQTSERVQAIRDELDAAASALEWAKAEYERTRVQYEMAREKFRLIRALAWPMITGYDWATWQSTHPAVRFAASELTDAVLEVLRESAYAAANRVMINGEKFDPWLSLEDITSKLEAGGFDFRTTAPMREVNAALLNMEGRVKDEKSGKYRLAESAQIMDFVKTVFERGGQQAE